jgi:hypothetical protein
MDQKLWVFEVLGEVWAGRACAGANQQEFTTCAEKGRQKKIYFFAQGEVRVPGREPVKLLDWQPLNFFILFSFSFSFWSYEELWGWAWHFGRMGVHHPHFLKVALVLHLEGWNLLFLIELGDFIFFANIWVNVDLHIHHWDFSFMKKCNLKKFHKKC